MKRFNMLSVLFILLGCAGQSKLNLAPMYGNAQKTPEMIQADNKFIAEAIKICGTRDSASRASSNRGWDYFYRSQYDLAMKRFNQAWLLDSTNASAYWGFGSILGELGSPADTVLRYFNIAVSYDSSNIRLISCLAYAYAKKAFVLKKINNNSWQTYADTSMALFRRNTSPTKENCDVVLQFWEASLLLDMKDMAARAKFIVDSTGIMPQNQKYYDHIVDLSKK